MKDHTLRLITDQRLINATHWTVFGLGATSLTISLVATAARVFAS
ncbi:MAG: hypothetical protein PHX82_03100 [Paracoccaceae bacterium]|jgi:hypothetical protein|nr:hypothetical protein [Paracoccaceae bacterium]